MERTVHYDLRSTVESQCSSDVLLKFFTQFRALKQDCYTTAYTVSTRESRLSIINIALASIRSVLPDSSPHVMSYDHLVTSITTDDAVFLTITDYRPDLWRSDITQDVRIIVHGEYDTVRSVMTNLKQRIPAIVVPVVTWEFVLSNHRRSQNINLEPAKPILKEFYPWIEDVPAYIDQFIASEESVLVLLGETGTGKTSFIRSMIWQKSLTTMFTYDSELLHSDGLFADLICNERVNLLVIEDADIFLTHREHSGNQVMAKFLNVTDGLASGSGRKKLIFTANILEPSKIDTALLRAGRCFDCLTFRRLTFAEACAAARAANIPVPRIEKDYTLAELFALSRNDRTSVHQGIGFRLNK